MTTGARKGEHHGLSPDHNDLRTTQRRTRRGQRLDDLVEVVSAIVIFGLVGSLTGMLQAAISFVQSTLGI